MHFSIFNFTIKISDILQIFSWLNCISTCSSLIRYTKNPGKLLETEENHPAYLEVFFENVFDHSSREAHRKISGLFSKNYCTSIAKTSEI